MANLGAAIRFAGDSLNWSDGLRMIAVDRLTDSELIALQLVQSIGELVPYQHVHSFHADDQIYALMDERSGLVKVGRSTNPPARLKAIKRKLNKHYGYQEHMPWATLMVVPMRIAAIVDVESMIHKSMARAQCVHPAFPCSEEWFLREAVTSKFIGGC